MILKVVKTGIHSLFVDITGQVLTGVFHYNRINHNKKLSNLLLNREHATFISSNLDNKAIIQRIIQRITESYEHSHLKKVVEMWRPFKCNMVLF